ncbi:MAG: hypothetical protein IJ390_08370 [Lachnospiraceae bacterium]|nr:hypothetical protein [Lachnospiraceae bacterium]
MDKDNKIRIACMLGGAALFFFICPAIFKQLPEETGAIWQMLSLMIINQIFIGVVGWQANYLPKFNIYIPGVMIVIYIISELVFYGTISWSMELEYLQTGYICYFLKKFISIRQKQEEKKKKDNFPSFVKNNKKK